MIDFILNDLLQMKPLILHATPLVHQSRLLQIFILDWYGISLHVCFNLKTDKHPSLY